mgnify:FL=1|tara:strand:+ start:376 stop:618 length:243 start_codon:yes stop_codon:yes gene_type:complete
MGWLFRDINEDSTEATLRKMHRADVVDNLYLKTSAWVKVVIFSTLAVFITSFLESRSDYSVWESTVDWFLDKISGIVGLE